MHRLKLDSKSRTKVKSMSENSKLSKKVHERINVLRNELNRDLQAARSLEEDNDEAIFESGYLLYFFVVGILNFQVVWRLTFLLSCRSCSSHWCYFAV